ncbi:MAG: hypothetical protein GX493_10370 [Firmicutes bacterium]|nr:hypothetical protein [Bacillota bacterium]
MVLVLAIALMVPAHAEPTVSEQIDELRAEIEALKAEVAELKAQLELLLKSTSQSGAFMVVQPPQGAPGYSRLNPAPIGTTLTITREGDFGKHTARITLLEIMRGEQAWNMVRQANPFNRPPKNGYEYLLAKIRFELVAMEDPEARLELSPGHFTAVSAEGEDYDYPLVVAPEPSISAKLYQGAQREGWVVFQIKIGDNPLITYGRDFKGKGGIWFKTAK